MLGNNEIRMSNDEAQKDWGVHPHRVLPSPKRSFATVPMRFFPVTILFGNAGAKLWKILTQRIRHGEQVSMNTTTKGKAEGTTTDCTDGTN